jgi:plastocyanin
MMGKHNRLILLFATLLAAAPLFAAAPSRGKQSVSIKDMKFDPASIDVKVGDTVTWSNDDDRDHSVVAKDGSFDSDNIRPGKTFSYKFTEAGKFSYSCSYHPRMKGVVNVTDKDK